MILIGWEETLPRKTVYAAKHRTRRKTLRLRKHYDSGSYTREGRRYAPSSSWGDMDPFHASKISLLSDSHATQQCRRVAIRFQVVQPIITSSL